MSRKLLGKNNSGHKGGKVSVISYFSYVYFLFIYFFPLIDVFFDVYSKSTIGFRRSHVVSEL